MRRTENMFLPRGASPAELGMTPPGQRYGNFSTYDSEATFVEQEYDYLPRETLYRVWDRFTGKDRRKIGWRESLKNIALSSGDWCQTMLLLGLIW
jgi:hypothetical protein